METCMMTRGKIPMMGKGKKGLLSKTWARCKSFSDSIGRKGSFGNIQNNPRMRCKSWPRGFITQETQYNDHEIRENSLKRKLQVAPEGCVSIYVGPQKDRFVIKTECVNHPLFKMLLEEAESEYGYSSEGPLLLPCEVNHFIKVLMKMDYHDEVVTSDCYEGCKLLPELNLHTTSLVEVGLLR